ncbi:MAG: hypothetical protein JXB34_03595 [Bacteroidales bacterium]|nr:hypothetical protein [Bacteroidales bacterium]
MKNFIQKHILFELLLVFLSFASARAQNTADSLVLYTNEFKFSEGLFPDFESVKNNSPIPKGRIVTEFDYNDNYFFENLTAQKSISYFDNLGNSIRLQTRNLWGYGKNGSLYINIDDGFYRITLIGSICHFIAYRTEVYRRSYYEPYAMSYPYYPGSTTTSTEMKQYLLDFNTGRIVLYDIAGLEVLLMPDAELHDEFMQLSSRKKKQLKFVYIRKFNERNPLYLVNNKL